MGVGSWLYEGEAGWKETDYHSSDQFLSEESSTEEQLLDSLEEFTMLDSGISEVSSEVSAVSVSEEIKRFQQEINKVVVENVKYPTWKQQKVGVKTKNASAENFLNSDLESMPPDLPPRGVGILAPQLPKNRKNIQKRVSYAVNEVTVLGSLEDIPAPLSGSQNTKKSYNQSLERSRQIQPSSRIAPAYPPTADEDVFNGIAATAEDDTTDDISDEDIPVLPSVKQLANRFQIQRPDNSEPVPVGDRKARLDRVAAMLAVNKPAGGYSQVHSITARSVSRQFRESLKIGKPEHTDDIFKLPEAKQNMGSTETVKNTNNNMANIIYKSSEPRSLYPEGDYIRNSGGARTTSDSKGQKERRIW